MVRTMRRPWDAIIRVWATIGGPSGWRVQPWDSDPMLDFDERDLVLLAEEAGFFPIQLVLEAEISAAGDLDLVARWTTASGSSRP
jgi:hypothetical protein